MGAFFLPLIIGSSVYVVWPDRDLTDSDNSLTGAPRTRALSP